MEAKLSELNACMTDHPDFPKPGVLFKNIMPIFNDSKKLNLLGEVLEVMGRTFFIQKTIPTVKGDVFVGSQ